MEAGSHSGIARLVLQSLGTGDLFSSYVFVTTILPFIYYYIWWTRNQGHKGLVVPCSPAEASCCVLHGATSILLFFHELSRVVGRVLRPGLQLGARSIR
jgi:hypothetical protein